MARRRDVLAAASSLAARLALSAAPAARPVPGAQGLAAVARAATVLPLGPVAVVGTRYHAASRAAPLLREGDPLELRREPLNHRDPYAVAVHASSGDRLGFLPRGENRRVAELLDSGARIVAEMMEGHPFEVTPGIWRIAARLSLHGVAAPPPPSDLQQEALADLLRASPLMAERRTGPDSGARAVMLAGPCAGWQRTKAAEWVPPGSVPWPDAEMVAQEYALAGGAYARHETARAMREAEARGRPVAGAPGAPRPPGALDRPPERIRTVFRGWLHTPAQGKAQPGMLAGMPFRPLDYPRLHRVPGRQARPRVEILDRHGRVLGRMARDAGSIVARLLDEGFSLEVHPCPLGPQPRPGGGLRVPYEVRLRGEDPPGIARRRAEMLLRIAAILPDGWDTERHFGTASVETLSSFLDIAGSPAVQNGGRLDERSATSLKAAVMAEAGPEY